MPSLFLLQVRGEPPSLAAGGQRYPSSGSDKTPELPPDSHPSPVPRPKYCVAPSGLRVSSQPGLLFFYLENHCSLVVGMMILSRLELYVQQSRAALKTPAGSRSFSVLPCTGPRTHWSVSLTWPSLKTLPIGFRPPTLFFHMYIGTCLCVVWVHTCTRTCTYTHTCGGHLSGCCTPCFLRRSLMGLGFA